MEEVEEEEEEAEEEEEEEKKEKEEEEEEEGRDPPQGGIVHWSARFPSGGKNWNTDLSFLSPRLGI